MIKEIMKKTASEYHGVRVRKDFTGRYVYCYSVPRVCSNVGQFKTPQEAARAYDHRAMRDNPAAPLNFYRKK